MVAAHDIPSGSSVEVSYGPLDNDTLLLDYGFLVPSNPHDRVGVTIAPELIQMVALHTFSGKLTLNGVQTWEFEQLLGKGLKVRSLLTFASSLACVDFL